MANGNGGGNGNQAAEFRRMLAASGSMVGRFTEPELFDTRDFSMAAQSTYTSDPLNINRPLDSIDIILRLRIAVTVGNIPAVSPEALQNLLQRVRLQGIHRSMGSQTPIDMSGALAFAWPCLTNPLGNAQIVNGVLAADPGTPFTSPFVGTTAGSPYDVIVCWHIPMSPLMGLGQMVKRQRTTFALMPGDWNNTLRLYLNWGDMTALGNTTGATVLATAFGSGAGTPQMRIHLNYTLLGDFAKGMRSGVIIRNEMQLTQFVSLATKARLFELQQQITPSVVVKSGIRETTLQSSGIVTFASLSDLLLNSTRIELDNKPVRDNTDNLIIKNYHQNMFGKRPPQGHFPLTFVDGQSVLLAYRGDGITSSARFLLYSDILTASANNLLTVTQEQILGGPFPALRGAA